MKCKAVLQNVSIPGMNFVIYAYLNHSQCLKQTSTKKDTLDFVDKIQSKLPKTKQC